MILNNITNAYVGTSEVKQICLGTYVIWQNGQPVVLYDVMCSGTISEYTGHAPSVWCYSTMKWYMRTVGGNYREYGIYAVGKPQDPYVGELASDNGHEWEYTASGWVDLGELTSRLPAGYTELEYVDNVNPNSDSSNVAAFQTDYYPNAATKLSFKMQTLFNTEHGRICGSGAWNSTTGFNVNYEVNSTGPFRIHWLGTTGWSISNKNGDFNPHVYLIDRNMAYIDGDLVLQGSTPTYSATDPMSIFNYTQGGALGTSQMHGRMFYFDIYDNDVLVNSLVPAKRDSDNVVGAYDIVNNEFMASANNNVFYAGPDVGGSAYPVEYDFKGEPDIEGMDYKVMITGSIEDYTGSEGKVYVIPEEKWYIRTIGGNYTEYGIYAKGKPEDPYIGELVTDNGHEWEYTASGWVDLGECTGGGSIPVETFSLNYNAKNMDGNKFLREDGQLVDDDATINGSDYTKNDGYVTISNTSAGNTYCAISGFQDYMNRTNSAPEITIISKAKTNPAYSDHYSLLCNRNNSSYNWMWRPYRNKLCLHGGSGEQGNLSIPQGEAVIGSARVNSNRQLILNDWSNDTTNTTNNFSYGSTVSSGFAMFRDYYNSTNEPWAGDFYWVFMCQSCLTDEQIQQIIDYNEIEGIELPKEYDPMEAPEPIDTFYETAADEYLKSNDNYYCKDYIDNLYQCGAYEETSEYVQGDQLTPIYVQGQESDFIIYEGGRYYKNYIYVQPVDQQLATGDYVRGEYIGPADILFSGTTSSSTDFTVKIDNVNTTAYITGQDGGLYTWAVYGDASQTITSLYQFARGNGNIRTCHMMINAANVNNTNQMFYNCGYLESVTLPNTLRVIGDDAFRTNSLTSITIPSSVTSIGGNAFNASNSLLSITIPNSITSIGNSAFGYCPNLASISIGSGLSSIGSQAFSNCINIESITVDANNVTYDSRDNCNAIIKKSTNSLVVGCKNTVIPNTVTSIGGSAFYNVGLINIDIPNSVTSIGQYSFRDNGSLEKVTFGNGITIIAQGAFYGDRKLKEVIIPSNVTSIGSDAFYQSYNAIFHIQATTPPTLGSSAFDRGYGIIYVPVGYGTTYKGTSGWSNYASRIYEEGETFSTAQVKGTALNNGSNVYLFFNASSTQYNANAISYNQDGTFNFICEPPANATSIGSNRSGTAAYYYSNDIVTIDLSGMPSTCVTLNKQTFRQRTNLVSVVLPSSLTSIKDTQFYKSTNLVSVNIPEGVTSIDGSFASGCSSLTNITLPSTLTAISNSMFNDCTNLASVNIPNSVNTIEGNAFNNCRSLTSITIPSSVTSIGQFSFNACVNAIFHVQATTPPTLGSGAFTNGNGIIYVPVGTAATYKAASGWSSYASRIYEEGQTPS